MSSASFYLCKELIPGGKRVCFVFRSLLMLSKLAYLLVFVGGCLLWF